MSLSTRLRSKRPEENMEVNRIMDTKGAALKQGLITVQDKRKAFGDIYNKIGSSSTEEQQKPITAVYKDVKPRVDTRWKKADAAAPRPKVAPAAASTIVPAAKPLSRQASKPKPLPEIVPLKKTLKSSRSIELKKEASAEPHVPPFLNTPDHIRIIRQAYAEIAKPFPQNCHSSKQLPHVDDIDWNDDENPQLLSVYVNDIYKYLFKLEKLFPIRDNFLSTQMDVTSKMRSVLLDWINEVHNQFSLEIETYHMAVSMIDRYLQSTSATPRRYLQLVGVTVLFMASKYEELMPPEINDFVYVTDDTYSKEQILQMEKKIIQALGFNLSKPLPIHFMRRFAKAAGAVGDRQYTAAKYFMELASIDYELTKYNPSMIAAASLYLSLYIFNSIKSNKDLWTPTLEHHSTYSVASMSSVVRRLAVLASTAKDAKLKSVFNKYSHALYKFTSTLPEMSGLKMQELVGSV